MKKFALFIALITTVLNVTAQDQNPPLKVGLILSGGGAKGFAHIGVLKVLEEAGVEISYIGGTSMGAIVGGLYASGYNATQIDSVFKATNFSELLSDFVPRSSKNFFGKRNDEIYAVTLPFNKFHLGIPSGWSKGMSTYNLLTKLTHNVRHVRDFSKLPIPFLCIASDIETGKEVILETGYLPQAIIASAAFPSLFSPVEIDGRLLVDGGITNNYPIDEIKKRGADFIIGVDVQDDLRDRNSLQDATRILVQISNLQMNDRMRENIEKTDIYIKPDITSFGVISFDDGREIIKKGEEAAQKVIRQLEAIAGDRKYKRPDFPARIDSLEIGNIHVNSLDNFTRAYVLSKLRFRSGTTIGYDQLKLGIDNLTATQNFSTISYSLEKNKLGTDDFTITLTENKVKTYLKFGLHYDDLYKTAILVNLTQKKLLFKNDVASLDIIVGDNSRYNFDYYIDNGFYFSFGFKSKYSRFNANIGTDFRSGELLNQLGLNAVNVNYSDFTNQAYVQTIFVEKFLLGAGAEFKHLKIKSENLQSINPVFDNSNYFSLFGYLKYDSFNNRYFPKKGWYFSGDFQSYLGSSDFSKQFVPFSIAKADAGIATTIYKKLTLKVTTEAGFALGETSVPFFDFNLGGYGFSPINNIRPFYGYDFLSLSGDSYIKSAATVDYEIFKKHHVNFSANMASVRNNLFESSDWVTDTKYLGFAVGYGLETFFGPIEIKHTWSPELTKAFTMFSVGFWF